jgi:hypothetical protein
VWGIGTAKRRTSRDGDVYAVVEATSKSRHQLFGELLWPPDVQSLSPRISHGIPVQPQDLAVAGSR